VLLGILDRAGPAECSIRVSLCDDPRVKLCDFETPLHVSQHKLDLLRRYSREPFQGLVNPRAAFEIFKERLHGHTPALEQPHAADLSGRAFNSWTLAPMKHEQKTYGMSGWPARRFLPFNSGLMTARVHSMKCFAAGLSVRPFIVTMTTGLG
jgi:hypothetical protein